MEMVKNKDKQKSEVEIKGGEEVNQMSKFREQGEKYEHQGRDITKEKCLRPPERESKWNW